MKEYFEQNGKRTTLIDLSDQLSNETSAFELNPHLITYLDHQAGVDVAEKELGLGKEFWPDEVAWAVEEVTLSTHSDTHIDAPVHLWSLDEWKPSLNHRPSSSTLVLWRRYLRCMGIGSPL